MGPWYTQRTGGLPLVHWFASDRIRARARPPEGASFPVTFLLNGGSS
jgi:hypothetical protein